MFLLIQLIVIDFVKDTFFIVWGKIQKENKRTKNIQVVKEVQVSLSHVCPRCVNEKVYIKVNLVITFHIMNLCI